MGVSLRSFSRVWMALLEQHSPSSPIFRLPQLTSLHRYLFYIQWHISHSRLCELCLVDKLESQSLHTLNDHQIRLWCATDPIETGVNHFWQDGDPMHAQICVQFWWLRTIIVACIGAFGLIHLCYFLSVTNPHGWNPICAHTKYSTFVAVDWVKLVQWFYLEGKMQSYNLVSYVV